MLASSLIIAICDTEYSGDVEITKFTHENQVNSLVRFMERFRCGFKHICGTPKDDSLYLMTDYPLNNVVPDLFFEYKSRKAPEQYYGYLVEDLEEPLFNK